MKRIGLIISGKIRPIRFIRVLSVLPPPDRIMLQWPSMDRRRLVTPVILILLFLAALVPRLMVLDTYVTADERKWLNRSGNFYLALSQGDWASTLQKAHPGVTVTWLGMLGFLQELPEFVDGIPTAISDDKLEALLWEQGPVTPLQLLAAGRRWTIFAIALAVAALYPAVAQDSMAHSGGDRRALRGLVTLLPRPVASTAPRWPAGCASACWRWRSFWPGSTPVGNGDI